LPFSQVIPNVGKFKPSELSRLLWGYAAAHHDDGALVKAVSKALTEKAADLAPKEAIQVGAHFRAGADSQVISWRAEWLCAGAKVADLAP
jgi:hypothetical protein